MAALLIAGPAWLPAPLAGQTLPQLFRVMEQGGTWLSLPIEDGRGTFEGLRVPTMGVALAGWFQVGDMHRGTWDIKVVDLESDATDPVIDVAVVPGQRVPFAYRPGPAVRVRIDVTWSEPADTLLWVWVGVPGRDGSGGG